MMRKVLSGDHPILDFDMRADSDEVAQAFRDDLARRSDMMSPSVPR